MLVDGREKHRQIRKTIACPNCHGTLSYINASYCDDILIAGRMICEKCSEIGLVANAKFIFNGNPAHLLADSQVFSEALSRNVSF